MTIRRGKGVVEMEAALGGSGWFWLVVPPVVFFVLTIYYYRSAGEKR